MDVLITRIAGDPCDGRLKLAEIARPGDCGDEGQRGLCEHTRLQPATGQYFFEHARDDHRHVLLPIPEWRQIDAHGGQAAK